MDRDLQTLASIESKIGKNYSFDKRMKGGIAGVARYRRTGKAEHVNVAAHWNSCECKADRRGPLGLWRWTPCKRHAQFADGKS
jgi:hypothetical protein